MNSHLEFWGKGIDEVISVIMYSDTLKTQYFTSVTFFK